MVMAGVPRLGAGTAADGNAAGRAVAASAKLVGAACETGAADAAGAEEAAGCRFGADAVTVAAEGGVPLAVGAGSTASAEDAGLGTGVGTAAGRTTVAFATVWVLDAGVATCVETAIAAGVGAATVLVIAGAAVRPGCVPVATGAAALPCA